MKLRVAVILAFTGCAHYHYDAPMNFAKVASDYRTLAIVAHAHMGMTGQQAHLASYPQTPWIRRQMTANFGDAVITPEVEKAFSDTADLAFSCAVLGQ